MADNDMEALRKVAEEARGRLQRFADEAANTTQSFTEAFFAAYFPGGRLAFAADLSALLSELEAVKGERDEAFDMLGAEIVALREDLDAAEAALDEPNYKALYTELKGEAVKAQRALAYIVDVAEEGYRGHAIIYLDPGEWSDLQSALSSLHEKLSSIEVFPEPASDGAASPATSGSEPSALDRARIFYLAMYGAEGGKWEAVDPRHHHVWIDKAERHAMLSNPSARGEL